MQKIARTVVPIRIQDEMRNSYMDYSMSVIIGRALPDVRDGLKPVHRRILYAMSQMGLRHDKKYIKCAGVVGEVLKLYHPHGDSAVYDALVRMAQPWNLRYMLVDGQGNFGSVDGDPAAAYRYTECRMTQIAEELLIDIDKETVERSPNFDGTTFEPDVLPSRIPNLLVNGADGIAVGMATKIPPHNLREIVDACIAVIEQPDITLSELMEIVPGPDFPTRGTIYGRKGVRQAYETGRGRVIIRGNAFFEDMKNNRRAIIIDELPYQVNKARLIEQIADLVKDKRLDGISALRDESDRRGMRVVIELKRDAFEEVVLNHLYKHTPLQSTFGVILLAIVNQQPRVLSLKEMLYHYVMHRREVIQRRTRYELRKATERAHILEGYLKALDFIDEVIRIIRSSPSVAEARSGLINRFEFSEVQANAILEMRLQRLTGMERQRLLDEHGELQVKIKSLTGILGDELRLMDVVKTELIEVRDQYGDERRTRFAENRGELTMHDLVASEDQVVTLSHLGYIKRCSPDEWRMQRRGGLGLRAMSTRDEDFVTSLFIANTHDTLLVFTNTGRAYRLPVYEVPEAGRTARGRPIVNLVQVAGDEQIAAVVAVPILKPTDKANEEEKDKEEKEKEERCLLFVSRQGLVKQTPLSAYRNLRQGGIIAAGVAEGDELMTVRLIESKDVHVMLFTRNGKSIRFKLEEAPQSGRTARGNRGMNLSKGDSVIDALLVPPGTADLVDLGPVEDTIELDTVELDALETEEEPEDASIIAEEWETTLLKVTELGYGKRTPFEEYRVQGRNGKGIISIQTPSSSGKVVGALEVRPDDQVMLVTDTGRVIRFRAEEVRLVKGRSTRGVRLMRLDGDERVVDLARLEEDEEEETEDSGSEAPSEEEAAPVAETEDSGSEAPSEEEAAPVAEA